MLSCASWRPLPTSFGMTKTSLPDPPLPSESDCADSAAATDVLTSAFDTLGVDGSDIAAFAVWVTVSCTVTVVAVLTTYTTPRRQSAELPQSAQPPSAYLYPSSFDPLQGTAAVYAEIVDRGTDASHRRRRCDLQYVSRVVGAPRRREGSARTARLSRRCSSGGPTSARHPTPNRIPTTPTTTPSPMPTPMLLNSPIRRAAGWSASPPSWC